MRLDLDAPIHLADEAVCFLADVVVDPRRRMITHVVVRPPGRFSSLRLVPEPDLRLDDSGELRLDCSTDGLRDYPFVDSTAYVELTQPIELDAGYQVGLERILTLPYYSVEFPDAPPAGFDLERVEVEYHRIPAGEVEIRRTSTVVMKDGQAAGRVDGFAVDGDGHITHLVLERGHLWGKRDILIPIGSVTRLGMDSVEVGLDADETDRLPRATVHRHR